MPTELSKNKGAVSQKGTQERHNSQDKQEQGLVPHCGIVREVVSNRKLRVENKVQRLYLTVLLIIIGTAEGTLKNVVAKTEKIWLHDIAI